MTIPFGVVFFLSGYSQLGLRIWWSKMIHWVAAIIPLVCGELIALIIYNMEWHTKAEANAQDKWERKNADFIYAFNLRVTNLRILK
jgi:hypothetical protein